MSGWSAGYVSDIEYIEGFYPAQAPARLSLACLMRGVQADIPGPGEAAHYMELGCGQGLNALVTAAANPAWQVTAIDYNPTHIAAGRAVARDAGLFNIRFLEADLASLAGSEAARSIPAADFTTLHGLWTWVSAEVRAGIVRLLAEKVAPGAPVHISYNAMPAWQGALGMQRLVFEAGRRGAIRSDHQAVAGLAVAREALAAGAPYLGDSSLVRELLGRTDTLSPQYLSHEYMNVHWRPAFHADLCRELADAKLDWVSSAAPLENFPQLMLSDEQRVLFERTGDPILQELLKDMFVPRQLRQDVFVRGVRRLSPALRDEALGRLELVPVRAASELETALQVPAGRAEMSDALSALMQGAMRGATTVADLLATQPGRSTPVELVGVLVGSGQVQLATAPARHDDAGAAARLNRCLAGRIRSLHGQHNTGALAAERLGTGYPASVLERFIAGRLLRGEREDRLDDWAATLSTDVSPDDRGKVAGLVAEAAFKRIPVMRALGIVPA